MPFDSNTDRSVFARGGQRSAAVRWGDKDPSTVRNKQLRLAVSEIELCMIDAKAAASSLSRVELIVQAVDRFPQRDDH